ncbi:hypothetical protein TSAR_008796 [Trichomalopsis sarcophagae]|uniref:Uncharacterized protein n=1 Tax=Trichomalopsis sarcophagae TaxID=543379 RepID=A0A232F8I5_9HYME|nr:hypothetical protein TSAR_008796 [Trichomalopsis sarcophagae]
MKRRPPWCPCAPKLRMRSSMLSSKKLFACRRNVFPECSHRASGICFCWITHDVNQLNCTQFNSLGEQTMRFALGQNYHRFGSWLGVSNPKSGGMLLLTSNCNDQSWCDSNTDAVQFNLYKVEQSRQGYAIGLIEQFSGIDCNYVRDVKTEVFEQDNGDICFVFACLVREGEAGDAHFYVKSKCIDASSAESSIQRSERARCDDSFDPNCNPLIIT